MPGTIPNRTRKKKDKLSVSLADNSRAENASVYTPGKIENEPNEIAEVDLDDEENSLSANSEMASPVPADDIYVKADETAKKKKVKKRVKLRLN